MAGLTSLETYLTKVYKTISEIFMNEVSVEVETPKFISYPYKTAWKGHNDAIEQVLRHDRTLLASPTGDGKTVVYLTAAVESGLKTLVITPRNKLQEQVAGYAGRIGMPIFYLFDRSKECNKKIGREVPCYRKFKKGNKWYFKLNGEIVEFPCEDCPYEETKATIKELFRDGECIVCLNQGNFWMLRSQAEFVIVDEADETLRSVSEAVSYPEVYQSEDPVEVLDWMEMKVKDMLEKVERMLEEERNESKLGKLNEVYNELEKKLRKINFFRTYPTEKLITYVKGRSTYVEIFDDITNLAKRLFGDAKLCLVTATPPTQSDFKVVKSERPFRARVIYAPIGNMSHRNVFVKGNEALLEIAVDVMIKIYDYTVKLTGMRKAPVHCGNLAKHGLRVYELFKANGRKALLMEEGHQAEYIKKFVEGDYDFFCAVAIEYGYDWGFSPIQYVLKVPFADLSDPRLQAIKKQLGKDKFNEWYNWDALSRLIQACGRNARRPNDFGITIILDSCFERLYKQYESKIPKWFKDRLVWLKEGVVDGNSN